MAHVTTNAAATTTPTVTRPNLAIAGRVTDASGAPAAVGLQLTVALEAVVPDYNVAEATELPADAAPFEVDHAYDVYDVYGVELRSDSDGRFSDSYDIDDEVRVRLEGWVMCTVQLKADTPGAPIRTKVVRWMRPTSADVITGLSALLSDVRVSS